MSKTPPPGKASVRRRRWLGRGSLWAIVLLFITSGTIRIVESDGLALARGTIDPAPHDDTPPDQDCATEPDLMALQRELQAREARVIENEGLLRDREQALQQAETRINRRLEDLVAAEEKLARTVSIADGAADEDVARLVSVYESMKPKEAAPLFSEMAPEFAAGFLARMHPAAAAAVMANLDPKEAYTISVIMAGRNAGAPKS